MTFHSIPFRFSYKLYAVQPRTIEQISNLTGWEFQDGIDFWEDPTQQYDDVDVLVDPAHQELFQNFLTRSSIGYRIESHNIQKYVKIAVDEIRLL